VGLAGKMHCCVLGWPVVQEQTAVRILSVVLLWALAFLSVMPMWASVLSSVVLMLVADSVAVLS